MKTTSLSKSPDSRGLPSKSQGSQGNAEKPCLKATMPATTKTQTNKKRIMAPDLNQFSGLKKVAQRIKNICHRSPLS